MEVENKEVKKEDGGFGDFEEIVDESQPQAEQSEHQTPGRFRMPRGEQKIGVILQRYGGNRMEIQCSDGKVRNCRVPGRYKRRLWLRPKDIVMVVPWEDDDERGDIIYKYRPGEVAQLRKRGMLDSMKDEF